MGQSDTEVFGSTTFFGKLTNRTKWFVRGDTRTVACNTNIFVLARDIFALVVAATDLGCTDVKIGDTGTVSTGGKARVLSVAVCIGATGDTVESNTDGVATKITIGAGTTGCAVVETVGCAGSSTTEARQTNGTTGTGFLLATGYTSRIDLAVLACAIGHTK